MPNDFAKPSKQVVRADIEQGYGAEPIDILAAELDATEGEYAKLKALYGYHGLFENDRKIVLAMQRIVVRDKWSTEGKKFTVDMVDDEARNSQPYQNCIAQGAIEAARFEVLDAQRSKITERIRRGDALIRAAGRV